MLGIRGGRLRALVVLARTAAKRVLLSMLGIVKGREQGRYNC
jgi:hypothetical protein